MCPEWTLRNWSGRVDLNHRPLGPEPNIHAMISERFRRFVGSGSNQVVIRRENRPLSPTIADNHIRQSSGILEVFERIEDFQSGPTEILLVARRDGEPVSSCRGGNVAVLDRHPATCFFELMLLLGPDVRHGDIEPVDATLHRVHQPSQPCLELLALTSFFRPDPVRQLRDYDCARVALVFLAFEPRDNLRVTAALGRLANDVRIEEPTHSFRRRAI